MSSKTASPARTERSLNISEIARDSSTPLGMTKTVRYRTRAVLHAFTIIELLVVIAIIIILAGLILATVGYVQKKGARARAETEIAAMSAACESYKADNGIYPRDTGGTTDNLAALTDPNYASKTPPDPVPTSYDSGDPRYSAASFYLYAQLSGNTSGDRSTQTQKSYFQFKPNMLSPPGGTGTV